MNQFFQRLNRMVGRLLNVCQVVFCFFDLPSQLVVTGLGFPAFGECIPQLGYLGFGRVALDSECVGVIVYSLFVLLDRLLRF